jgi:hypothetical protein
LANAFVPEGQADSSQARNAWVAMHRDLVPEGRSKSLSVPNGAKLRLIEVVFAPKEGYRIQPWVLVSPRDICRPKGVHSALENARYPC